MTLIAANGLMVPTMAGLGSQGVTAASLLMDATGEKVACVFRAPKAGNLARIIFRTMTVTTGDDLKVSFQDVDPATGLPDGTPDQYRTVTVLSTDDNAWFRTGIMSSDGTDGGSTRTVAAGDSVCVVIEFNSYVAGAINIGFGNSAIALRGTAYVAHYTASWAKSATTFPLLGIEYDDGSFAYTPGVIPGAPFGGITMSTSTTPDEAGLIITLPYRARVWGAWFMTTLGGDAQAVLYDGATVLDSMSWDKDVVGGVSTINYAIFATQPILIAGAAYRLILKPTTTTSLALSSLDVAPTPGAAQLDQMDGGQNIHWTQRTDAGAWSQITTRRAYMGLILAAIDDGATRGGRIRQVVGKSRRRNVA